MQDTNEPGINGVSIDLIDSSNSVVDTRVTAGSGNYAFASPASGDYTIDVTSTLTGYTLTTGNEPFALNGYVNGTAVDNVDFGYRQTGSGSIGGLVWNDLDGDGSAAGEPGIGNVTVDLYRDLNNSDTLDAGDAYVGTRTTTGSGNYDFTGLPDAEYVVDVTDTNNVLVGKSVTGGTDLAAVSLSGGAAINDIDFGYAELSCTTVDLQQGLNGYSGAADTYIWQAQATTNFEDTTPTPLLADGDDPSGSGNDVSSLLSWDISSIPAGSEIQSASIRINVENATAAPGFDLYAMEQAWTEGGATWETYDGSTVWPGGSGGAGTGSRGSTALGNVAPTSTDFYDLTLNSAGVSVLQDWLDNPANNRGLMVWAGSTTDGLDFSAKENGITASRPRLRVEYCQLVIPRDLGDRVWDDRDFDGIQDVGEPGLIAVTINLLDAGLNQVDTTTSDSDGRYGFSGLTNGATYTLEVEVPEGYRLTPKDLGANDAADSDAIPASGRTLPFVWSGLDETRDFGLYLAPGPAYPSLCYAASDNGGGAESDDLWSFEYDPVTRAVSNPQELVTDVLTSPDANLESIEFDFDTGLILAGGSGGTLDHRIIEIDPNNGFAVTTWGPFSTGLDGINEAGTGTGTENITDIDGLAYDPFNKTWYASARDGDNAANTTSSLPSTPRARTSSRDISPTATATVTMTTFCARAA